MGSFAYVAKSQDNRRVKGTIEADSLKSAESQLAGEFQVVYRLEEISKEQKVLRFLSALAPIKLEELVGLSQAVSSMAEGGISLQRTIDILYEDSDNPTLKRLLGDVADDVSEGKTLSEALMRHTEVFPRYYVAMTAAGESSGNLPEMMRRLAQIITSVEMLQARARAALSYPVFLFGFTLVTFLFFFTYGSPYLERIYDSLDISPPLATQMLLGLGVSLADNKLAMVFLVFAVAYLFWSLPRNPTGRRLLDRTRLYLPLLGKVYEVLYTARFLRTMAILYRSGLPLAESVRLSAATVGNELVMEELFDLSLRLERGEELSKALRSSRYVSKLAVGMISAGEESGKLEVMLSRVADVYEVKSETMLQSIRSNIEPTLMLLLGLLVAGFLCALGWPLLALVTNH